jgi:hypothetical protein
MLDDSFPLASARRPLTHGCHVQHACGGHEGTLPFPARAVWFDDDGATIDLQPTADRARAAVVSRDERFVVIATARGLLLRVALSETGAPS